MDPVELEATNAEEGKISYDHGENDDDDYRAVRITKVVKTETPTVKAMKLMKLSTTLR